MNRPIDIWTQVDRSSLRRSNDMKSTHANIFTHILVTALAQIITKPILALTSEDDRNDTFCVASGLSGFLSG